MKFPRRAEIQESIPTLMSSSAMAVLGDITLSANRGTKDELIDREVRLRPIRRQPRDGDEDQAAARILTAMREAPAQDSFRVSHKPAAPQHSRSPSADSSPRDRDAASF